MKVIYPVLFYEEKENGYSVFVPDLKNVSTCGENLEEAMSMAQELIDSTVLDEMDEKSIIPTASKIENVSFAKLEKELNIENWNYVSKFKTYISVDLSAYAEKWGKKLVKKTVNIPMWINTKAEEQNINFTTTLEEVLLEKIYK